MRTDTDAAQLQFALRTGRVLVTHDADFLRIAAQGVAHLGLAFCDRTSRSLGEMIRSLILIYEALAPEEIAGQVEYL